MFARRLDCLTSRFATLSFISLHVMSDAANFRLFKGSKDGADGWSAIMKVGHKRLGARS